MWRDEAFAKSIDLFCSDIISKHPFLRCPQGVQNCTELNKVYPGGVALPGAVNAGGVTKKEPKYDAALYQANKKSDRDGDGIACEK